MSEEKDERMDSERVPERPRDAASGPTPAESITISPGSPLSPFPGEGFINRTRPAATEKEKEQRKLVLPDAPDPSWL